MERLRGWNGAYCMESFHPGALLWLKKHEPGVLRGQLSQNFLREGQESGLPWLVRFALTYLLTTIFTRPDFIAYNYEDRMNLSLQMMKRRYGVHEVGWTIRNLVKLEYLEWCGVTPIFEGFSEIPEVPTIHEILEFMEGPDVPELLRQKELQGRGRLPGQEA